MASYLHKKHFSLDEARTFLTQVHALTTKIIELKRSLELLGWDVYHHEYFGGRGPNGNGAFPPEMELLVSLVQTLAEGGVVVKGLEDGLIDFPYIREDGEEVYLCWKVGENDIMYWHTITGGFAGRKSLEEL